jgi:putative transposase
MVAAVERRFGRVNQVPSPIEWLTDNGSCYLARTNEPSHRPLSDLKAKSIPNYRGQP